MEEMVKTLFSDVLVYTRSFFLYPKLWSTNEIINDTHENGQKQQKSSKPAGTQQNAAKQQKEQNAAARQTAIQTTLYLYG